MLGAPPEVGKQLHQHRAGPGGLVGEPFKVAGGRPAAGGLDRLLHRLDHPQPVESLLPVGVHRPFRHPDGFPGEAGEGVGLRPAEAFPGLLDFQEPLGDIPGEKGHPPGVGGGCQHLGKPPQFPGGHPDLPQPPKGRWDLPFEDGRGGRFFQRHLFMAGAGVSEPLRRLPQGVQPQFRQPDDLLPPLPEGLMGIGGSAVEALKPDFPHRPLPSAQRQQLAARQPGQFLNIQIQSIPSPPPGGVTVPFAIKREKTAFHLPENRPSSGKSGFPAATNTASIVPDLKADVKSGKGRCKGVWRKSADLWYTFFI